MIIESTSSKAIPRYVGGDENSGNFSPFFYYCSMLFWEGQCGWGGGRDLWAYLGLGIWDFKREMGGRHWAKNGVDGMICVPSPSRIYSYYGGLNLRRLSAYAGPPEDFFRGQSGKEGARI